MATLTHSQARASIQAAEDRPLTSDESRSLAEHLRGCGECRAYNADITSLSSALPRVFSERWGAGRVSSAAVLGGVLQGWRGPARRQIPGFARLRLVAAPLAGLMALLVVGSALAFTLQAQPGGLSALIFGDESTATSTQCREACETLEPDASHTPEPTHMHEASATTCGEDCETHTPEPSHTPEASRTHPPEPSRTVTRTPEATRTHEPEASEAPEPTHEVEASETPEPTHEPEASEAPEPTHEVEASHTPEPTHEVEASHTPEPTRTPTSTHMPEPTSTPTATQN